jgi:hypothetical protein
VFFTEPSKPTCCGKFLFHVWKSVPQGRSQERKPAFSCVGPGFGEKQVIVFYCPCRVVVYRLFYEAAEARRANFVETVEGLLKDAMADGIDYRDDLKVLAPFIIPVINALSCLVP